ncbi:MAG: ABC transporter ATP-binding protein [Crocinitomicaceae bacterium]|nr:ABC transporter ATP-binding protein [Crocinitomicaceae bacterium]
MNTVLLQLSGLDVGYPERKLLTIESASLKAGEMVALIGRNGTGKTTLIKTLAGILKPLAGSVLVGGNELFAMKPAERAKMVSLVLTQRLPLLGMDVRTLVSLGRYPHAGSFGWITKEDERIADQCIERLGIANLALKALSELSDGEMQKVMIARALAQQSPVMILDEPTAFLDYVAKEELFVLLRSLSKEEDVAILFSSHDLSLAAQFASRQWVVENGLLTGH